MHINKKIIFIFFCGLFLSFTPTNKSNSWVLKKESNGIRVYSREVSNTGIRELKAVTQIKTSLNSIIALLNDRESFPEWVYKCGKASVIKNINEKEAIVYQNVIAPWPIDNRDIVIDVKVEQNQETKVVVQKAIAQPTFIPSEKDHVRIMQFTATWKLTPLPNGIVNCEYQLLFDPGGNLPIWLINLAATEGPYETTLNMRKIVMREKYQNTHYSYITEL